MTESDIATLCHEGIAVDEKNDPSPENVKQSDDILPTSSSLNFGFHVVDPWRQSGNFPVGKAKINMTTIPRINHMYRLDLFTKLYLMEYIKDVVIPETNKHISSAMNLSEYFPMIGCHLIMACYVGHSFRDFFVKDTITHQKCAPIRLNYIVSGRFLENITQVMSYTNLAITDFNDAFFQQRHMQEGRNKNTAAHFDPSWVSVIDDSIQEWIERYN